MQRLRHALAGFRSRPKAHLALAFVVVSNHFATAGHAAAPSLAAITGGSPAAVACSRVIDASQSKCTLAGTDSMQFSVPAGQQACPDSGTGVACGQSDAQNPDQGVASTPSGAAACANSAALPAPNSPAACSDTVLPPATAPAAGSLGDSSSVPAVVPSVPIASLRGGLPAGRLELGVDNATAMPGRPVVLTATADASVTGTGRALEIFDLSTGTLAAQCSSGGQCAVAYTAHSGVHTFQAFIGVPGTAAPTGSSVVASNRVDVSWIGVALSAKATIVGPGQSVTVTTASTIPIDKTGWLLQIYDVNTKGRLTYCSQGSTCSTTLIQPVGGARSIVAALAPPSPTFPAADRVVAQSDLLTATWLSVGVDAYTRDPRPGGSVTVTAYANADLSGTPWSLGIFDASSQLVSPPCRATSCTANVPITGAVPSFFAAVGTPSAPSAAGKLGQVLQKVTGPSSFGNVQARSTLVKPAVRTAPQVWGVDSCRAFTDGLYTQTASTLGAPDFWGRYLTWTVCAGLSPDEIHAASSLHMGILPIYNDYNCSNVSGYATGMNYALLAAQAAQSLGVPYSRGLVIDIESPGDACPGAAYVDASFLEGWYDGIVGSHYVPVYYANASEGSAFAGAWCMAVSTNPAIAANSFIWSSEPSLLGDFNKTTAPGFQPYVTGCPGHASAWQYQIGSDSSTPDVDGDEAVSELPIWYP